MHDTCVSLRPLLDAVGETSPKTRRFSNVVTSAQREALRLADAAKTACGEERDVLQFIDDRAVRLLAHLRTVRTEVKQRAAGEFGERESATLVAIGDVEICHWQIEESLMRTRLKAA